MGGEKGSSMPRLFCGTVWVILCHCKETLRCFHWTNYICTFLERDTLGEPMRLLYISDHDGHARYWNLGQSGCYAPRDRAGMSERGIWEAGSRCSTFSKLYDWHLVPDPLGANFLVSKQGILEGMGSHMWWCWRSCLLVLREPCSWIQLGRQNSR